MAFYLKSAAYTRTFKMISSTDHFSLKTGITPTVNISKAGAAFAASTNAAAEIGATGWYKVVLTTTETNTAGDLTYYITGSGADDTDFVDQILDPTVATFGANLVNVAGSAVSATTAQLGVNVVNYNNAAVSTAAAGIPKVDVDTIKTNPVVNAGTITFPTTATLASTTNITGGTITTVSAVTGLTAATVHSDLDDIQARLPAALTAGGNIKADALAINGVATTAVTTVKAVQGLAVDGVITTLTNLPAITANWLTAAGIAATALNGKGDWNSGKTGYTLTPTTGLGNQTADITGSLSGTVAGVTPATAAQVAAVLTTQITESYRANAAAPTLAQFMSEVLAHLGEVAISGTTKTILKLDHSTAAETFTLDNALTPAAITRAT